MIKLPIYKIMLSTMLGILLIANACSALADSVAWQSYSNHIFTSAKKQNKLILIYVKSDTCHWCARMNSEVLNSPAIVTLIYKKFIPVAVDVESDKSISDEYGVNGTPTFIILDGDHHEISRLIGFRSANEFESYLNGI